MTAFPIPPNRLIGRECETVAVAELLTAGGARLVTLIGPGGVGKTRLMLHVASTVAASFPQGARLVRLAAVTAAGRVLPEIAHQLGLREEGRVTIEHLLASHLREQRLLLLLDNMEQIPHAAPIVAGLLADAPGITILATSREPLHVYGEREYQIEPFPVVSGTDATAIIAASPAVALFAERAQAVSHAFDITPANASIVAEICDRLDGLPLAIELAASRIKLLPPRAILARLEHRLHVLTGGALDLPERQRTLRKAIAWSYDLLEADEQRLFRRLSIFEGGCTLEAAEAVCGPAGTIDVLDGMASLVNKCLVRTAGTDERPRFTMLATIAEFAREQLAERGELPALRAARDAWCRRVIVVEAPAHLSGPHHVEWMRLIRDELDNVRAALASMRDRGDAPGMLEIAVGMARFWGHHGSPTEGRAWLDEALRLDAADAQDGEASGAGRTELRAWALMHAGLLAYYQTDYLAGIGLCERALELFERLDHRSGMATTQANLGQIHRAVGQYSTALPLINAGLEGFRVLGDRWGEGLCHQYLATYHLLLDHPEARDAAMRAVEIFEEIGDEVYLIYSHGVLAHVCLWQNAIDEADVLLAGVLPRAREWNDQRGIARVLKMQGEVASTRRRYAEAAELYRASLRLLWERDDRWHAVNCVHGFAAVAAETGRTELGARLLGVVEGAEPHVVHPRTAAYRRLEERVRGTMPAAEFEAAFAEGHRMSLADAVQAIMTMGDIQPSDPAEEAPLVAPAAPSSTVNESSSAQPAAAGLTSRETEILRMIAGGRTDAQVAEALFISPRTVNAHLRSVYAKLGVANRSAATRYAIEHGLA